MANDLHEQWRELRAQGRWAEAVAVYARAIENEPGDRWAYYYQGVALLRLDRFQDARDAFQRAIELAPEWYWPRHHLGDALQGLGLFEDATDSYRRAIDLSTESASSHHKLGDALRELGRLEDAANAYGQAVRLAPEVALFHAKHALVLASLDRPTEAVGAFEEAVRLGHDRPYLHSKFGDCLNALERWNDAARAFERAVELAPEVAMFHDKRGLALARLERWQESARAHQNAIRVDPMKHGYFAQFDRGEAREDRPVALGFVRLNDAGIPARQDGTYRPHGEVRKRLDVTRYDTDKISAHPHHLRRYEEHFEHLVDRPVTLLELGVRAGGSLLMWRDYFEQGTIVGIDIRPVELDDDSGRVHVLRGHQEDTAFLDDVSARHAPDGYDIIIDDASHVAEFTRVSLLHLFENHLKPGGLFVIEDWETGYFDEWPDGRALELRADVLEASEDGRVKRRLPSHDHGMVGLVKQVIDAVSRGSISVTVEPGQVFIFKW